MFVIAVMLKQTKTGWRYDEIFLGIFFFCLHGEITIFFSVVSVGFNFLHKYVSFIMKISQHTPK